MKSVVPASLAVLIAMGSAGPSWADAGIVSELDLGVEAHDVPIGDPHEEPGADVSGEVMFVSPAILAPIWAPRPNFGLTINTVGKNSWAYGGLVWTVPIWQSFFGNLGLGGAVHDGPDVSSATDHKGLGTRVLFHEEVELGYRFSPVWNVGLFMEHVSNADLGSHNPGVTDLGLRFGHSF